MRRLHTTVETIVYVACARTHTLGIRYALQIARYAGFPTATDLGVNFSLTTPQGLLRGDFFTTEHAPGFTIFLHFSLSYDIRDMTGGCGKWREYRF